MSIQTPNSPRRRRLVLSAATALGLTLGGAVVASATTGAADEVDGANEVDDANEVDGVDCEDGIDSKTGAECDGGPAANATEAGE